MTKKEIQDYKDKRNLKYGFNAYWNKGFNEAITLLNKQEKAINYTHSCTELKDKEAITFEDWLKVNCEYLNDDYYLYNEETYNRYDIHTKFITEIKQNL